MSQNPLSVSLEKKSHLIAEILSDISSKYRLDLTQDPVAMKRISEAVDQACQALESRPEAEINLPHLSANPSGPIHYRRIVTRVELGLALPETWRSMESPSRVETEEGQKPKRVSIKLPDRKPVVTYGLMAITILIYGLQLLTNLTLGYDLPARLGLKANELILAGQYWRLVTPMFLHGSILHIGFNMYALYILGRRVERYFGSYRFLGLYFIAGITGNIFSFFFTTSPSLGASTAIFGILGAEGVFIYQHRKLFGEQSRVALWQIIQIAAINLLIGLTPGIDNWGHVGGLVGGVIFAGLSGPLFKIGGIPPALRLENSRSIRTASLGYVAQLIITAGLAYLIILTRG